MLHITCINKGKNGNKILVAEDNKINQLIISKILTNEGYEVLMTSDGKECINALEKNPDVNLILMDIQMPIMDGLQATEHIRDILKNDEIKIIALTAHTLSGTREMVIKNGMNDYLTKPIDRNELFEMFEKWIYA